MIKNSIVEESTPVFGDAPEAEPPAQNKVLSWDEEKTLLVFEDEEDTVSARLRNLESGEVFELSEFPYLVGRNKTADLQIKHRSVSREHARISLQSGASGFIVEDTGSSNGIRVNGIKTTKVMLGDNDRIKFGDVEFLFDVDSGVETEASSAAVVANDDSSALSGTAVELHQSPADAASSSEADGLTSGMSWASVKQRVASKLPGGLVKHRANDDEDVADGETVKKSRYPLLAAAAVVVLGLAYVLSPARRVEIIDVPAVAKAPATSEAEAAPAAADESEPAVQESAAQEPAATGQAVADTADDASTSEQEAMANNSAEDSASVGSPENEPGKPDAPAASAPVASSEVTTDTLLADAESAVTEAKDAVTDLTATNQTAATGDSAETADATATVASTVAEAPKPVIRRSPEWSRGYIRNSLEMYTQGDVDNAVRRLRILSRSGRHQPQFRQQAGDLADGIDAMYQKYQNGRVQFDSGRHDEAFQVWRSFLVDEANLLPGEESVFSRNIKSEVVNLYTQQGNTANAEGRGHEAYLAWQKASTIAPGGEAAAALADLEKRAKQRFIDGYMQESVSLQTATSMWRDVLEMVPPANEYHIKAKAKLRLYKNYGS